MSLLIPTPTRDPMKTEALRLRVEGLEAQVRELSGCKPAGGGVALMLHDCRLDLVLAGMSIATGAAAMGEPAHVFFAFGATAALRRPGARPAESFAARVLARVLRHRRMRELGKENLEQQLQMARDLGVKMYVCETSMQMLGFGVEDLVDYPGLEACGVATFLSHALESRVSLAL